MNIKTKKGIIIFGLFLLSIVLAVLISKTYMYYKGKIYLTGAEKKWLKENEIIIAPDPALCPVEYKDPNGDYKGFSADYIQLIEKKINKKTKVKWYNNWNEINEALRYGEIDISTFIVATDERKKYTHFCKPYLTINIVFIVKNEKNYEEIKELNGKTIGVIEGYSTHEQLKNIPNYRLLLVENAEKLFEKLEKEEVDAIVIDEITVIDYLNRENHSDIKYLGNFGNGFSGGLGINKSKIYLKEIMDKAVESISEKDIVRLKQKWFENYIIPQNETKNEYIFIIVTFNIVFVLLLIGMILWNKLLKKEVAKKTKELRIASRFFSDAKEGMIVMDQKGILKDANDAFLKMIAYKKSDVLEKHISVFKSEKEKLSLYKEKISLNNTANDEEGEVWFRRKNGEDFLAWFSLHKLKDKNDKEVNSICIVEDLTNHKKKQESINWLSNYDLLTGLPNQMLFRDRLNQTIKKYELSQKRFAVMYIDVNNFKIINENLGYAKGDSVLFMISERLKNILSPVYTLSRISGDHFTLLIPYIDSLKELEGIAKKILFAFNEKFIMDDREFFINLSLGIAIYPEDRDMNHGIVNSAFKALKHSKSTGKNSYQFYSNELGTSIREKLKMDSLMREAIAKNELYLNYQPQLDLTTKKIVGMEALVRWNSPELGIVSPAMFIPLAEENGMIVKIGEWVLEKACEDIKKILLKGYRTRVSVNLSPVQFKQMNLLETIQEIIRKWNIPPYLMELEITEGIFLDNITRNIYILNEIRNMSIKIALDDFGTGYSSLSYLQNFKFDRLKLDQSFVRNMDKNENRKICETIIDLAHKLGLKAIAEGVETKEHYDFLKDKKCDEIQGYYFSRPIMFEDMLKLLEETNKD